MKRPLFQVVCVFLGLIYGSMEIDVLLFNVTLTVALYIVSKGGYLIYNLISRHFDEKCFRWIFRAWYGELWRNQTVCNKVLFWQCVCPPSQCYSKTAPLERHCLYFTRFTDVSWTASVITCSFRSYVNVIVTGRWQREIKRRSWLTLHSGSPFLLGRGFSVTATVSLRDKNPAICSLQGIAEVSLTPV
jgi:uncharacterized PurR-regulated membrane protein YhhQ (DUF165 family)